jgi:hypothetical protein
VSVCCKCCVLSGRGLCDELIARPEESYRMWCVVVCDLEKQTSWMRRPSPTSGLSRQRKNTFWLDSSLISDTQLTRLTCAPTNFWMAFTVSHSAGKQSND